MTISSTGNRAAYAGNDATTAFAFPYLFQANSDLIVYTQIVATLVTVPLTMGTHYSVTGAGNPSGGTVTMVTPPPTGTNLVIVRAAPYTQGSVFPNNGAFDGPTVEAAYDKNTILCQQVLDGQTRSLTLGPADISGSGAYAAGGNKIQNCADGVAATDVATKGQVASMVFGGAGMLVSSFMTGMLAAANAAAARVILSIPNTPITPQSSNHTVVAGDLGQLFNCTGDVALQLPTSASIGNGFMFAVRNAGTGSVSVIAAGSDVIDSVSTLNLNRNDSCFIVANGGSGWRTIGLQQSSIATQDNIIMCGACSIGQGLDYVASVSGTYGFSPVDVGQGHSGALTGTTVAGTMKFTNAFSTFAPLYFASKWENVTTTGAGVVKERVRIRANYVRKLRNGAGSFSVRVYQDTGSTVPYTIVIRKANATNDFSSVTTIATSAALNVPTATDTTLLFESVAMGDCSNGVEIEISAAVGAVTNKNLYSANWQLLDGVKAPAFSALNRNDYIQQAQASYIKSYNQGVAPGTVTNAGVYAFTLGTASQVNWPVSFPSTMDSTPAVTVYNPNSGATGSVRDISGAPADRTTTPSVIGDSRFTFSTIGGVANDIYYGHFVADCRL